eukprot:CAMPEP_0174239026 /NCGR_PEP_ID=MMETSP0417-20130205/13209_1 /TAXON_ID=242541 /ORGANISM="Mayorella sp, Strain BSH-02190019" /LENGTH=192 /DNA_ID=CAMNT_0015317925 /DNA_START=86 /DNA_END=661 /DNA_ORIENTATION=-
MPILYALVARGDAVLAEHAVATGNFVTVSRVILSKIPADETRKMSYAYDDYVFHYMVEQQITYLCMTEREFPARIVFGFLNDVAGRLNAMYTPEQLQTSLAFSLNTSFSRTLERQMDHFSNDPSVDSIELAKSKIDQTKSQMTENLDLLLERGPKIDLLVDRTNTLDQQAYVYKQESKKLKCAMLVRSVRCW